LFVIVSLDVAFGIGWERNFDVIGTFYHGGRQPLLHRGSNTNSAGYGGPYQFSTNNSFRLLFMMLLKLGNLWSFNQVKLLIFTVHNEIQYNCSPVRFLKKSSVSNSMQYKKVQGGQIHKI